MSYDDWLSTEPEGCPDPTCADCELIDCTCGDMEDNVPDTLARGPDGKCVRYSSFGSYSVIHVGVKGSVYCCVCADAELAKAADPADFSVDVPVRSATYDAGPPLECDGDADGCVGPIESSYYGDPYASDDPDASGEA